MSVERFYHSKGERYLNESEVIPHIRIPKNPDLIPQILLWAGPGRCGSTALLMLLTGNIAEIARGYYQPLKTIIRYGGSDFVVYPGDLICFKEVFGPRADQEYYDPGRMLIKAGVPPEKIGAILMLKDPVPSFASWYYFTGEDSNPHRFAQAQAHTISLYHQYQEKGIRVVPFAYELLEGREREIINLLLESLGMSIGVESLRFNREVLGITPDGDFELRGSPKMIWNEAVSRDHWEAVVKPIVEAGAYQHVPPNQKKLAQLPDEWKIQVEALCREEYKYFLALARQELGISF